MPLATRMARLALAGAAVAAAAAPLASAAPLVSVKVPGVTSLAVTDPCAAPVSQVFAPWGDSAFYSLVRGGGFEAGAPGWTLSGGARVVRDGDDGNPADGVADAQALELGRGASAVSPEICVGTDSAAYRLFANAAAGGGTANLRVEVLFAGLAVKADDLRAPAGASVPTPKLSFVPPVLDRLLARAGTASTVRIRLTSLGGATVRVDDVNMDPRMH